MIQLPLELIHQILSYTNNDLRISKIKMDETNIKYLFEHIEELSDYLWAKTSSTTPVLGECVYITTVILLKDKSQNMDNIKNIICNKYKIEKTYFDFILNKLIIPDYNDYYLNDDYYYGGYWNDEEWIKYEDDEYYNEYNDNEYKNIE